MESRRIDNAALGLFPILHYHNTPVTILCKTKKTYSPDEGDFQTNIKSIAMSKEKEVKEYYVSKGIKLECLICKSTLFWTRTTLMNTTGMSIMGLDWANKNATNYVCNSCGYVHWFLDS